METKKRSAVQHSLRLRTIADNFDRIGCHKEADELDQQLRSVHAQVARNVGEFTGWAAKGLADGVTTVGKVMGRGISDFAGGVAGGWSGNYAPASQAADPNGAPVPYDVNVNTPGRTETAHLPPRAVSDWMYKHQTNLEIFTARCKDWAAQHGGYPALMNHLESAGVPQVVTKWVSIEWDKR